MTKLQATIATKLQLPTHARTVPRNTAAYVRDDSGRIARERYCLTCTAWDVTGNHGRAGHKVCR